MPRDFKKEPYTTDQNDCEHCGTFTFTEPTKDPEEGSAGRLYDLCKGCKKKMVDAFCAGDEEENYY